MKLENLDVRFFNSKYVYFKDSTLHGRKDLKIRFKIPANLDIFLSQSELIWFYSIVQFAFMLMNELPLGLGKM